MTPTPHSPDDGVDSLWATLRESDKRYMIQFDGQRREIEALRREIAVALEAAKEAITKAEIAVEKRLVALGELIENVRQSMEGLRISMKQSEGKGAGLNAMWGYILGAGGLVLAIIAAISASG